MAGSKTVETVKALIKPTIEEMGLKLWDVRFLKEGASWYLRIFIDKEEGIDINDCTDVSHAIDPIIDEADPIDKAYFLEVCSPGLGREIREEEHFEAVLGKPIIIKLFRALDGSKELKGELKGFDKEKITLSAASGEMEILRQDISKINLDDIDF